MIPPADGLSENELGMFVKIIKDVQDSKNDDGTAYYTFISKHLFKSLCELGVIGVSTVTHHDWINSNSPRKDGYLVWVTEKGHQYMRGEVNVSKPCLLRTSRHYTSYSVCKFHKRKHTKEEYEQNRSSFSH